MIQLPSTSAPSFRGSPRPALPGGAQGAAFVTLFGPDAAVEGGDEAAGRQSLAGSGKDLPDEGEDADAPASDVDTVAFAWFAIPVTPPVAARPILLPLPGGSPQPDAPAQAFATPAGDAARPAAVDKPAPATRGQKPVAAPVKGGFPDLPVAAQPPELPAGDAMAAVPKPPVVLRGEPREAGRVQIAVSRMPVLRNDAPAPVPHVEIVQAFALQTGAQAPAAPRRPAAREAPAPVGLAGIATDGQHAPRVAAAPDAQQAALDTRRHEWVATMVDRIEAMRDAGGTRETNIRLSPDALGAVEVAIARDGDRIHVRFTAETPAARALLAEAQPRLAELAEARGIRLGQTSVDAGTAGQGGQRRDAPRPTLAAAPARAPRAAVAVDSDQRIA